MWKSGNSLISLLVCSTTYLSGRGDAGFAAHPMWTQGLWYEQKENEWPIGPLALKLT